VKFPFHCFASPEVRAPGVCWADSALAIVRFPAVAWSCCPCLDLSLAREPQIACWWSLDANSHWGRIFWMIPEQHLIPAIRATKCWPWQVQAFVEYSGGGIPHANRTVIALQTAHLMIGRWRQSWLEQIFQSLHSSFARLYKPLLGSWNQSVSAVYQGAVRLLRFSGWECERGTLHRKVVRS
jgi:hypothetical protein